MAAVIVALAEAVTARDEGSSWYRDDNPPVVAFVRKALRALVDREDIFKTPTLLRVSDGFRRLLAVVECPLWYKDEEGLAWIVAYLEGQGLIEEVPEAELVKFCREPGDPPRPCLPLRRYWGEGAKGYRVTEKGRRLA
jgi:hypothetical protein